MKLIQRQFLLPILIGVSFISVGIASIYCWYKKDDDDTTDDNQIRIGRHKLTKEFKVPRQFVPVVIGRGGATIKDVENKSSARIRFKEDNIECPDRICLIQGTLESVNLAEAMITTIIANQPIIETYEMYVPQQACGRIIGRGGETIHQIQSLSSAKIIVENGFSTNHQDSERRIIIKGTAEQIATALSQIEDKVKEEKETRIQLETNSSTRLPRGKLSPRNTAVNVPESPMKLTEVTLQLDSDGLMEVYVSAMESPSLFFIQLVGSGTIALDTLISDMTTYYNTKENYEMHILKNITVGQMVAAKFSFDEKWYRAEVLSSPVDGFCEVYFVDFGDHERVDTSFILELPTNFLILGVQAVECSLANVKPW
ncbi:hypothetical protein KPH14_011356 [Odynerus spinipes]|uniref:Tudor domain-containing protein n=1 Tax=Odynerus spinipes TaxID=1348599 RepID=A0AAD9VN41_9HYME|nr:hypothetical protein KPH14_011356 [Odynerus spinipes]